MTQALVWPIVTIVILIAFRGVLKSIAERVLTFRIRDFEFAFANKAVEVADHIPPSEAADKPTTEPDDALIHLAEKSPRFAIMETWIQVEGNLRKIAAARGIDAEKQPFSKLVQILEREGVLDNNTVTSLRGLMALRNIAVHSSENELTTQQAIDFLMLARALSFVLSTKE